MELLGDEDGADATTVLAGLLQIIESPRFVPGLTVLEATAIGSQRVHLLFAHSSRPGKRYLYERETGGGSSDLAVDLEERIESSGGLPKRGRTDPIPV